MKHLLFIFYFNVHLFCCSLRTYGQNDSILPNLEASYNLLNMTPDNLFSWVFIPESVYFINIAENDTINVYGDCQAKIFMDGYKAYILSNQIGSSLNIYNDSAVVLYDFSLEVGDTAYYEDNDPTQGPTDPVIVDSVTTHLIENIPHKKLVLSNNDIWVQGIGSLIHPLWPVMSHFEKAYVFCSVYYETISSTGFQAHNYVHENCAGYSTIGMNEIQKNDRKLIRSIDILGKEIKPISNTVFFNIYDDGSIERIYIVE
jgi:hypothetical protein